MIYQLRNLETQQDAVLTGIDMDTLIIGLQALQKVPTTARIKLHIMNLEDKLKQLHGQDKISETTGGYDGR